MKLSTSKKILLLGLILLIIAGVIVIALKGLNVSLMFKDHETVNLYIGKEIDYNEFKNLCKEIFGDKKVVLRRVELFGDSISINVSSITDEEKENLANKINEKYVDEDGDKYTAENITVRSVPKVRIRDIIRPYVKPVLISAVLILAYMLIKFRKMKAYELLGKIALILIVSEIALISFIAIVRIPVTSIVINLMFVMAVIELVVYNIKLEKTYNQ